MKKIFKIAYIFVIIIGKVVTQEHNANREKGNCKTVYNLAGFKSQINWRFRSRNNLKVANKTLTSKTNFPDVRVKSHKL